MFEQEIDMEKRQSSVIPLLLIVGLIVVIVGVAAYYVLENKKVLATEDAARLVTNSLKEQGPATMQFRVGRVAASVDARPHDPNYRLLEKVGLIKIGKDQGRYTPIALTPAGEAFLKAVPGVTKVKTSTDDSETYVVPLAEHKLVSAPKVTMLAIGRANIQFDWSWDTTKMGDLFDASGSEVKSFNTWDRGTLIDKYGAKFYHAAPVHAVIAVTRNDKGVWQISPE